MTHSLDHLHDLRTPPADDGRPIAEAVVDRAIHWFVLQSSGHTSAADRRALQAWREAHPDHAHALARLEHMGQIMLGHNAGAPDLARATLTRAGRMGRRRMLGHLLCAGAAGALLWYGRDELHALAAPADLSTAAGELRRITLEDGTQLHLNSATAVDLRYDDKARRIVLREGEIEVVTAPDPAGRPLSIDTRDARLVPVGTRFHVLQLADHSRLGVSEGAVDILFRNRGSTARIEAGQQAQFDHDRLLARTGLDESTHAWTEGMLVAVNRRLDDFLAEIARHRAGHLQWSPEVAALRITGSWPLHGDQPTDTVLASLERRLPVRIQTLTRYWVRVLPRAEG